MLLIVCTANILSVFSRGAVVCLLSAAAFGAMGIFGKLAFDDGATAGTLLAARFAIAAVALWCLMLIKGSLSQMRAVAPRDLTIALGARRVWVRAPGRVLFRRARASRRIAAVARPVHVPGDRHRCRSGARARAPRPPPRARTRSRIDGAGAHPWHSGGLERQRCQRRAGAWGGVHVQRVHPHQRRRRAPRAGARARHTCLHWRRGLAHRRIGPHRTAAPRSRSRSPGGAGSPASPSSPPSERSRSSSQDSVESDRRARRSSRPSSPWSPSCSQPLSWPSTSRRSSSPAEHSCSRPCSSYASDHDHQAAPESARPASVRTRSPRRT